MESDEFFGKVGDVMIDFMYYLADQGEGELIRKILQGAQMERDRFLVREFARYMRETGWIVEDIEEA